MQYIRHLFILFVQIFVWYAVINNTAFPPFNSGLRKQMYVAETIYMVKLCIKESLSKM